MTKGTAFYVQDQDLFLPQDWTRGPWDPKFQHAGPPAALLGRAIEQLDSGAEFSVARITIEVLRPIPLSPLQIQAMLRQAGRRVQLAEAVLSHDGIELA